VADLPCQFAPLPDRASIDVRGRDAHAFLAAQLSRVPPAPDARRATLAAWHDAKGRVQALFHVTSREGAYSLVTHASVAADVAVALRRYVLRADVQIEVADADVGALLGDCGHRTGAHGLDIDAQTAATTDTGDVEVLRVGPALLYAIGPTMALERLAGALEPVGASAVDLAEIRLGIPVVGAALRGLFLPQMLNLDRLGAIAFDKGCYPGQEIIARTQNLGTVKRRLHRFAFTAAGDLPDPGAKLLDAAGREVGVVVRAAAAQRNAELLAVVELDALASPLTGEWSPAVTLRATAP
jgi:hypothetical protein